MRAGGDQALASLFVCVIGNSSGGGWVLLSVGPACFEAVGLALWLAHRIGWYCSWTNVAVATPRAEGVEAVEAPTARAYPGLRGTQRSGKGHQAK